MPDFLRALIITLITPSRVSSLIRKGLMFLGGVFVTKGYVTDGSWADFTAAAVAIIFPIVWGWVEKGFVERLIQTAGKASPAEDITTVDRAKELQALTLRHGL